MEKDKNNSGFSSNIIKLPKHIQDKIDKERDQNKILEEQVIQEEKITKEDQINQDTNEEQKEKKKFKITKDSMKRIALYLVGFFSGMSVMAIELGAQRLMTPYFSSSQIIWTIIIGTIMIAMAIGNIIGGKMADKSKTPTKLFVLLFAAAIWVLLIPLLGKLVIAGISLGLAASSLAHNFLIWAALLSCLIVFIFPLLVLGMVTPNLAKFATRSLNESGKTIGKIEAFNTIGSIIGTFMPTFVTIPTIGTSWTFIIFGLILLVISLVYFFKIGYKKIFHLVLATIILGLTIPTTFISPAFWMKSTIYEGESIYNYLRVEEQDDKIILSTNVLFGVQSAKMKNNELSGLYCDYAMAGNLMTPNEKPDILMLGLCTGTYFTQTVNFFPAMYGDLDGVEIDQKIVDLAYEYFDLPQEVNVFVNDGRAFMNLCTKKYDVIFVDAFHDITIPFSMSSIEFFQLVKNQLKENGVLVINLNMSSSREGSINDYIYGTVTKVFNNVYKMPCGTNVEVFASNNDSMLDVYEGRVQTLSGGKLKNRMTYINNTLRETNEYGKLENKLLKEDYEQYILTDDKAPVELLGMKVLDDMIVDELEYYRAQLKGKSIIQIIKELLSGNLF